MAGVAMHSKNNFIKQVIVKFTNGDELAIQARLHLFVYNQNPSFFL